MRQHPIRLTPLRFLSLLLGCALLVLVAVLFLPHSRYVRFQYLTKPTVVKASWIYQRIHFDPTPIDVAFIGTSHTNFGIDSPAVEAACKVAGGPSCSTVNFGMEQLGRNVHWLLTRELLQARQPKLMIIEVQETEYRAGHPAFPYLAGVSDIAAAPLLINTSYFAELARLPLRQMTLFAETMLPSWFGVHRTFEPQAYWGSQWSDSYAEHGSPEHPIALPVPRTQTVSGPELQHERSHANALVDSHLRLPASLQFLEYRSNLIYLRKLLDLAREHHVAIRFLYMPKYHVQTPPLFLQLYDKYAPVWSMPRDIIDNSNLWTDVGHLNYAGAIQVSQWIGNRIAATEQEQASARR